MRRNTGYTNLVISSCPCHIPVIQHMHPNDIPISQGSTWCRRLAAKGYTELGPLLLSPATKSLQSTKDNSRIIWRHCGGSVVPLLFWVLLEVEVDDVHVSQSDLVMTGDTTGFTLPRCLADTFYQEYIALFIVEYSHLYCFPKKPMFDSMIHFQYIWCPIQHQHYRTSRPHSTQQKHYIPTQWLRRFWCSLAPGLVER